MKEWALKNPGEVKLVSCKKAMKEYGHDGRTVDMKTYELGLKYMQSVKLKK
jgi:hypothetical protein